MSDYKKDVHPKTRDDGAVVISIGLVPLHLAVVRRMELSFSQNGI